MKMKEGQFFVLEGTDGSGKTEQFKLLLKRLKKERHETKVFDFPQYGKPSAYFVEKYLNGKYGGWKEVGPYKTSVFFAVDRYDIVPWLLKWIQLGKIAASNRFVPANMGHQGAKIDNRVDRIKFWKWVYNFEYGIMGIPKPTITIILHVPAKIAYNLIAQKSQRKYLGKKKRDIHEKSIDHLQKAEQAYLEMVKTFPKDFVVIECAQEGKLLSIEAVHELVWNIVEKHLK